MIKRIEITNFMSHAHTVIDFADGLTVLIGENNTGKSAIVNALHVLCTNAQGDYMVRHGEKECIIKVETSEGHIIKWRRKGKTVSYNINGKDIHRLGGSIPDELHDILRLSKVETENDSFDIHFGEQKEPIFLLNKSSGKRASFFASSSDAIKLIEMQRLHKKNIQDAKWRENKLVKDEIRYKKRIEKLEPIDKIYININNIEREYKNINKKSLYIEKLNNYIIKLKKSAYIYSKWNNISYAAKNIERPPKLHDTKPIELLIKSAKKKIKEINLEKSKCKKLQNLLMPPYIEDIKPLNNLILKLYYHNIQYEKNSFIQFLLEKTSHPPIFKDTLHIKSLIKKYKKAENKMYYFQNKAYALINCEKPPKIFNIDNIKGLIDIIQKINFKIKAIKNSYNNLLHLQNPPNIMDLSDLNNIIEKIKKSKTEYKKRKLSFDKAGKNLFFAKEKLKKFIEKTEICPTCGQKLMLDALITKPDKIKNYDNKSLKRI
jgi:AAA15 family ATPase/GTPase